MRVSRRTLEKDHGSMVPGDCAKVDHAFSLFEDLELILGDDGLVDAANYVVGDGGPDLIGRRLAVNHGDSDYWQGVY